MPNETSLSERALVLGKERSTELRSPKRIGKSFHNIEGIAGRGYDIYHQNNFLINDDVIVLEVKISEQEMLPIKTLTFGGLT